MTKISIFLDMVLSNIGGTTDYVIEKLLKQGS